MSGVISKHYDQDMRVFIFSSFLLSFFPSFLILFLFTLQYPHPRNARYARLSSKEVNKYLLGFQSCACYVVNTNVSRYDSSVYIIWYFTDEVFIPVAYLIFWPLLWFFSAVETVIKSAVGIFQNFFRVLTHFCSTTYRLRAFKLSHTTRISLRMSQTSVRYKRIWP